MTHLVLFGILHSWSEKDALLAVVQELPGIIRIGNRIRVQAPGRRAQARIVYGAVGSWLIKNAEPRLIARFKSGERMATRHWRCTRSRART